MQSSLLETREQFHTSIRKSKKTLGHLTFRNNLQLLHTIRYVEELKIENDEVKYSLGYMILQLEDQANDIDGKRIFREVVELYKYIKQGKQFLISVIHSRMPGILNYSAQLLGDMKLKNQDIENKEKAEQIIKYLFLKINQQIKEGTLNKAAILQLERLNANIDLNDQEQVKHANDTLFYFSAAILDPLVLDELIHSVYFPQIFNLITKFQCIGEFDKIANSTLSFFRSYICIIKNNPKQYHIPSSIRKFIFSIVEDIINHSADHVTEVKYRLISHKTEQLLYSLYIYDALSEPILSLSEIPYEHFHPIIKCRYRLYNMYKYILKICLKAMKHSQESAKKLLNDEDFSEIVRVSQRINHYEVLEVLIVLLDFEQSPRKLKAAIITLILDIPTAIKHVREESFKIMFKYFQNINFSTQSPEVRIALRKVAENIEPYSIFSEEVKMWRNLICFGYQSYVPRYMKDALQDILNQTEKQRLEKMELEGDIEEIA